MSDKRKTERWIARDRICGREGTVVELDPELGIVLTPQFCPDCHRLAQWDLLRRADVSADNSGQSAPAKDGKKAKAKDNKVATAAAKLFGGG